MTSNLTNERSDLTPSLPTEGPAVHQSRPLIRDELNEVLSALAIPFDLQVVQWRVTEWSDDGRHGMMMPTPIPGPTATG